MDQAIMREAEGWMRMESICRAAAVLLLIGAAWIFWKMQVYRVIKDYAARAGRRYGKIWILLFAAGWAGILLPGKELTGAQRDKKEETECTAQVQLEAIDGANKEGDIIYYNKGVNGRISFEKNLMETGQVYLCAVALDDVAAESADGGKRNVIYGKEDGAEPTLWEIKDWVCQEGEEETVVEFRFQEQGKWQILCRVLSEEELVGAETGNTEKEPQILQEEKSDVFVIDGRAPELEVRYGNCRSISDAPSSVENVNRQIRRGLREIISPDCEVTVEDAGKVEFRIREDYFIPENVKIRVMEETYADGKIRDVTASMQEGKGWDTEWKKEGDVYVLCLRWERAGHFRFEAEYADPAGNPLEGENDRETEVCMKGSVYMGPMYTVDDAAPVFRGFSYEKKPVREQGIRAYFREEPVLLVEVVEENFNQVDYSMRDVLTWADGELMQPPVSEDAYTVLWTSRYENGERINRAYIRIGQEGNHTFSGQVTDGGGKKSAVRTGACTYDTTEPEIRLSISGEDAVRTYESYQYFGRKTMRLLVTVSDRISGVRFISASREHKQGNIWKSAGTETVWNEKTDAKQEDLSEYQWEIPLEGEFFQGRYCLKAEDFAGNAVSPAVSPGIVLESPQHHEKTGSVRWEISEADRVDEVRKILYYRKPFSITAVAEDTCSGIGELRIKAGVHRDGGSGSGGEKALFSEKTNRYGEEDNVWGDRLTMEIRPGAMKETSPGDPVWAEVLLTDNAGNQTEKRYKEYTLVADATKPEIHVTYDVQNKDSGMYYNCARTATVTVRDRNFNPESVRWEIAGTNRKYRISPWSSEGELHRCRVRFAEDGENYQIRLSVEDYAGNRSVWDKDTAFTIDRTPPEVSMKIQVDEAENGKYYKDPQRVIFTVKDRNMDARKGLVCFVNGKENPCALSRTKGSLFSAEGMFQAEKLFEKDGTYRVRYRCTDLAGNVTVQEESVRFVIDGTAPRIEVTGVTDGAAYGGVIRPEAVVTDRNLEPDTVAVRISREDGGAFSVGKDVPVQVVDGRKKDAEGAASASVWERKLVWEEFPYTEAADGVYRLQAYARDKAGNQTSLGDGITFTVNRFGAVYYYKKALEDIIEKGYMTKEEGLVITETSVNPLDSRIIILKDNQNRRELRVPGEKYTVSDGRISTEEEGRKGWYIRRHYISAENFQEEGTYQITVQSGSYVEEGGKRRWVRETSNELKEMPIFFTVDRTPPAVEISGLDDVLYGEGEYPFMVTVMDNYEFAGMELKIRYEGRGNKEEVLRITREDLGKDHSVEKELRAYEGKQIISCRAWDRAGNYLDTSEAGREITCVVTDEPAIRVRYENPWIFRIAIAAAGSAILAVILCIHAAWSKKNAEDA